MQCQYQGWRFSTSCLLPKLPAKHIILSITIIVTISSCDQSFDGYGYKQMVSIFIIMSFLNSVFHLVVIKVYLCLIILSIQCILGLSLFVFASNLHAMPSAEYGQLGFSAHHKLWWSARSTEFERKMENETTQIESWIGVLSALGFSNLQLIKITWFLDWLGLQTDFF